MAKAVHWTTAAMIVVTWPIGLAMTSSAVPPAARFTMMQAHFSIGVFLLFLIVVRCVWRASHRPPPLPPTMPAWERVAAGASETLLYALLIALPLSGWAFLSLSLFRWPATIVGLVDLPPIRALAMLGRAGKLRWSPVALTLHVYGAFVLLAMVALHVGAALRHRFVLRDGVLDRMLPHGRRAGPAS